MKNIFVTLIFIFISFATKALEIDSIQIYPQPAVHYVNFTKVGNDTTKFDIIVFNKFGRKMAIATNTKTLHLKDIPTGEYIFIVADRQRCNGIEVPTYRLLVNVIN